MSVLFAPGFGSTYGRGDVGRLAEDLASASSATLVSEPMGPAELTMASDGTLPGGYRFTQQGLSQVCSELAPGLFRLILDLSGELRRPDEAHECYSAIEAIALYNSLLRRRFHQKVLDRVRLVKNARALTIDGIVGLKHVLLDNADFFRRVNRNDVISKGRQVFVQATLTNRRLSLRYASPKRLCVDPDGTAWHPGSWLCNSEVGRESPASGSPLLYVHGPGLFALGRPVRGRRVLHVGSGFDARVERMLKDVLAAEPPHNLAALIDRAAASPLGLPPPGQARADRVSRIAATLQRRGVPMDLGRQAVAAAVSGIRTNTPGETFGPPVQDSDRFSLYRSLMLLAQSQHEAAREKLERAAHDLLIPPSPPPTR